MENVPVLGCSGVADEDAESVGGPNEGAVSVEERRLELPLVEGVTIDELALGWADSEAFIGVAEALRERFDLGLLKALWGFEGDVDAECEGFDGESDH